MQSRFSISKILRAPKCKNYSSTNFTWPLQCKIKCNFLNPLRRLYSSTPTIVKLRICMVKYRDVKKPRCIRIWANLPPWWWMALTREIQLTLKTYPIGPRFTIIASTVVYYPPRVTASSTRNDPVLKLLLRTRVDLTQPRPRKSFAIEQKLPKSPPLPRWWSSCPGATTVCRLFMVGTLNPPVVSSILLLDFN